MPAHEIRKNCVLTGNTGWISIHIDDSATARNMPCSSADVLSQSRSLDPAGCIAFGQLKQTRTPLPERFPRLTLFAIALALLVSALTAEFDYLRSAGYYWP